MSMYLAMMMKRENERLKRPRPKHFEVWDEEDFFQRFRLSRTVENILEEIEDTISFPTNRLVIVIGLLVH